MRRNLSLPTVEKPLSSQEVAGVLDSFAGTGAEWWLQVSSRLADRVREARLVVMQLQHCHGCWLLHSMAFGAVVLRLHRQAENPFGIAHASGLQYEEHEHTQTLIAEAKRLRWELPEVLNLLLRRRYLLEDASVQTNEAAAWLATARELTATEAWSSMCLMLRNVGPPQYKVHSSQFAQLVAAIRSRQQAVEKFVERPYPGPLHDVQMLAVAKPGRRWYSDNEYWRDGLLPGSSDPGPPYNNWPSRQINQPVSYVEQETQSEESCEEEVQLTRQEVKAELLAMRDQLNALLERL